jgi:hypothetical protein
MAFQAFQAMGLVIWRLGGASSFLVLTLLLWIGSRWHGAELFVNDSFKIVDDFFFFFFFDFPILLAAVPLVGLLFLLVASRFSFLAH